MADDKKFDIFSINAGDYATPPPSSSATAKPTENVSKAPGIEVRWQDAVPAAAVAGGGAGINYLANKLFPYETQDQKIAGTQSKIDFLQREQANIARDIESQRAPYLAEKAAITTAEEAAKMEALRNEMLMRHATNRALSLGVNPSTFLSQPETFQRAMSPQKGFGTLNWANQEIKDLNPIVAERAGVKSEYVPAYKEHKLSAPRAEEVVGPTVMQKSGIYTPERIGPEQTAAGQTLSNIERTYLEAQQAAKEAEAATAAMPPPPSVPAEGQQKRVENKLTDARIRLQELLGMQGAKPGPLERLAEMLSGPKVAAGMGAIGSLEIAAALRELKKENPDYVNALLNAMGGTGGLLMGLPHPGAKVIGAALSAPPLAYHIVPHAWEAGKSLYNKMSK